MKRPFNPPPIHQFIGTGLATKPMSDDDAASLPAPDGARNGAGNMRRRNPPDLLRSFQLVIRIGTRSAGGNCRAADRSKRRSPKLRHSRSRWRATVEGGWKFLSASRL